uniref:NB-ARC domain-containing protein n=1 Tax=Oryza barthii TaxID=65489 RepID=A0A0D3HIJ7_9ORYZ
MEILISAVASDLISRFISSVTQNYRNHIHKEDDRRRLERILLRMHSVVEEAGGRHITNQGMILQLKGLVEGFYLGYYMLDKIKFQPPEEESIEYEVSHEIQSFALSACNSAKRFRFADAISKRTPVAFGSRRRTNLKDVVDGLETKIADMREFVILLGSHPRLPREPYNTYLYIDNFMFGRRIEKEQVINFLLSNDPDDPYVSILPILGPPRIGKKTLVQHACLDERVRNCFSHIFFFKEDDLKTGELSLNSKASQGKYLFVIEFIWDVDEAAWTKFQSYLQNMPGTGIKVVLIGTTEDIAKFGTTQPIRVKRPSEEEYWYYFKALAFGSMDPDEHPKLASLAMQLATEMNGSFLSATVYCELLRANPNTQFWKRILLFLRELARKHLTSSGLHPDDLFERNIPVDMSRIAVVDGQVQGCLVYDVRVAGPADGELPKLTSRDMLLGRHIPVEDKFDVLAWRSRIPPYCNYIVTYEKRKPRRMINFFLVWSRKFEEDMLISVVAKVIMSTISSPSRVQTIKEYLEKLSAGSRRNRRKKKISGERRERWMAGVEEGGLTEASTVAGFLGVPWDSHRRPPDSVFAPVNRRRAPRLITLQTPILTSKRALVSMEIMISAVAGDLISRFISSVTQNYRNHIRKEDDRRRLERILLRMHCVVEEAEGRHITNQGMLLQLKGFIQGFYLGYYVLDKIKFQPPEEESIEDEVSHEIQSFDLSACNSRKRFRFADAIRKHTPTAFGSRSRTNLKDVVDGLETKIADMREFVILLGSHARLPRQPYSTYLYIENCMFGRRIEKEQVINFLLCNDPYDPYVSILPIIGPPRIGKKTLVQHACLDERVRNCFSHIFFFKEDDLKTGELSLNSKASQGKYLFVIEFIWDVDEAAWTKFHSYLQNMPGTGIKVVVIGTTEDIAKFGTTQPIRVKRPSEEEFWYYFKALAFGSMDPDEHPKLASLAMQLATEMNGSFLSATIYGELLRANPDTQFWKRILLFVRELAQKHLTSSGLHPDDLFERNIPVDMSRIAVVDGQVQGCLVYDVRVAGPAEGELPKLTSRDMLLGGDIPVEDKFDVLVWRSRIPPYCNYIVTYEKRKPRRMKPGHFANSHFDHLLPSRALVSMEILISAVASELISRFISSLQQYYSNHTSEEDDRTRLQRILLRMHSVVEEAEGRHITNQGMLLQLRGLIEGFYHGYHILDKVTFQPPEEESIKDEVIHEINSSALITSNSAKRFRFADALRKHTPISFASRSTTNLKGVVEDLETKIADMREFVMLLGSYPRLPRQPYSTYLFMDKCMFGRRVEKEKVIDFLLCSDLPDTYVSILPIIGPHRIGKKTLVQHACQDDRVKSCFSHIFFFKEDDLKMGELLLNSKASPGKYLFVIEFICDVNEAAWTKFQSYLQNMPSTEIKVVIIGRTEDVTKFGTTQPIRMKRLSEEEYWYYFKALSFGSMNPDEHPKLASLGMQLATEMNGSFLGANILGELLRANPNTQLWQSILLSLRGFVQKNLCCFGVHPEDLLERNTPVDFTRMAFLGAQVHGCLVYDLRVAGPAQSQLPKLTSREVLLGGNIPVEQKFDVLVWKSRIPPYCDYIATFEKQKPRRVVGKRNTIYH